MTQACQNDPDPIVLIPLPQLHPSSANARKTLTEEAEAIETLAATIAAEGLLQNLVVVPVPQKEHEPTRYEVVAGGRRLRALNQLASSGQLSPDFPVPCRVVPETEAMTASLIENHTQAPMHPADEFEAFKALADSGKTIDAIAALFGVSSRLVQRRLKLARLSPKLLALFREDEIGLEQLMALALSDDHATQERLWFSLSAWERSAAGLRRRIIEQTQGIEAQHPLARCVGLEAYEAAGGGVRRDLFAEADAGYLTDRALLEQLAQEKLEAAAADVRAEGWGWVEVRLDYDYSEFASYTRVWPIRRPLTAAQQAEWEALSAQQATLQEQIDALPEDCPNDAAVLTLQQQGAQTEARIAALAAAAEGWEPETLAQAGAVVSIGRDGGIEIRRGWMRPEPPQATSSKRPRAAAPSEKPVYSEKLMRRLTAQRTAAMQAELTQRPEVALAALAHHLVLSVFARAGGSQSALQVSVESTDALLPEAAPDIESSRAWQTLREQRAAWEKRLAEGGDDLLGWLLKQPQQTVLSLLAFCMAATVNGVTGTRTAHPVERLAQALSLDMAKWWQPTQDSYFMHVPKAQIVEAVSKAVSKAEADKLMKMKKAQAAQAAQRLVSQTPWLPEVMRGKDAACAG